MRQSSEYIEYLYLNEIINMKVYRCDEILRGYMRIKIFLLLLPGNIYDTNVVTGYHNDTHSKYCLMSVCYNFPVIAIIFTLIWSYYVYTYIYCFFYIDTVIYRIPLLIFYNILFFLLLWCLWAAAYTRMYEVPFQYKVSQRDHAILMQQSEAARSRILEDVCHRTGLKIYTRTPNGYLRYCITCLNIKPDRTHHCSACGMCVLKMDHHCPFLNNCIGLANYKQFVLMLFYGFLYTLYYFCCALPTFIDYCAGKSTLEKHYMQMQTVVAFVLAYVMAGWFNFYLCRHLVLVLKNQTTIETKYAPLFANHSLTFDTTLRSNFTGAFGRDPCLWFLPLPTMYDVLQDSDFPVRELTMADHVTVNLTYTDILPCLS